MGEIFNFGIADQMQNPKNGITQMYAAIDKSSLNPALYISKILKNEIELPFGLDNSRKIIRSIHEKNIQ